MKNWSGGGITGSLAGWVAKDVRSQVSANLIARKARYGAVDTLRRSFFSGGSFVTLTVSYVVVLCATILMEVVVASQWPEWLNPQMLPPANRTIDSFLPVAATALITVQVSVLGVISIAISLVALIAERDNASTDVALYYHESQAFEIVASSIALLAILCLQLGWPFHYFLHTMGAGSRHLIYKMALLSIHGIWLLINLEALSHFVRTTFRFVRLSDREQLRERYIANFIHPANLRQRLRQQHYHSAGETISSRISGSKPSGLPAVSFGYDYGTGRTVELQLSQSRILYDVHLAIADWSIGRWAKRCTAAGHSFSSSDSLLRDDGPSLYFGALLDELTRPGQAWCTRQGGVPLDWLERLALSLAFRFRREEK